MKKVTLLAIVSLILFSSAFAEAQDTLVQAQKKIKKGWNIGPLPAIGYNSDLGFQYGALADFYYFGDGSTFPEYIHKFNIEVSQYTKGTGVYHLFYDSKHLLKGIRTTIDISYLTDKMMDFIGYNGYMSAYDAVYADANPSFYKMDRRLMRVTADFQGSLGGNWSWAAGIGMYSYKIGEVRLEKYAAADNVYSHYVNAGLIGSGEASGGTRVELKVGLVHDTRNNEVDPTRGMWSEAILFGSPGSSSYLKLSLVHRGFVPVAGDRLTFAYRVAVQANIAGEAPFYMQQNLTTLYFRQISSEGLGGVNTIRGLIRNRVVGQGVAWANLELRYRFLDFRFLKQDWYLALNPFFDAGRTIQYYKSDLMRQSSDPVIFPQDSEALHMTAGLGIKAIMNRNFVVSFEWGKPFDKRDGKNGMNIGLNYIF
ncbi:MAG: BamA/TamA family outer membrane protein [Bacteroidales bacterium]|nr:BamA/TamA family outer membrane protein [Bacteroidales bacterium]